MFRLLVVVGLCCGLGSMAGEHTLLLKFGDQVAVENLLADYDVRSFKRVNNKSIYRVSIISELSRSELLAQIYEMPELVSGEANQTGSLVGQIDSTVIDQSSSSELDQVTLDQRSIIILDETGNANFSGVFSQYFVTMVRADWSWPYATGTGVTVAILDTGIDMDHEFLVGNISPDAYDFVDNDADPSEVQAFIDTNENGVVDEGWGHGTHVAGIVKTIAPTVNILPIRVSDSDGQADLFDIIQGFEYALAKGARVINLSMSIMEDSPILEDLLDAAAARHCVVITSAGNENSSTLAFPATNPTTLTVTSIGADYVKSSFANYSSLVDVSAPGENILSAMPGNLYVRRSGTSMAAPIVAGQAAIILEMAPGATHRYVTNRIVNNSFKIDGFNAAPHRHKLGKGLVDVWNAITLQQQ